MLNPVERAAVEEAAINGETGFAIEVLRSLAGAGLLAKIPAVISVFAERVEMNQEPVKNFLAHRVPAILTNNYFPIIFAPNVRSAGPITYEDFIDWSLDTNGWADPIVAAARSGDTSKFVQAVQDVTAQISRWKSRSRQVM